MKTRLTFTFEDGKTQVVEYHPPKVFDSFDELSNWFYDLMAGREIIRIKLDDASHWIINPAYIQKFLLEKIEE